MPYQYNFPPIGGFGNPAHPWSPNTTIEALDLEAHIGKALLMIVDAKPIAGVRFKAYAPMGAFERPSWNVKGMPARIYPSATIARSSAAEDLPSNQWVPDLLQPTLNYGRSLFQSADPRNVSNPAQGVIDLDDASDQLEYLFDYSWDGADITITRGYADELFSAWNVVGRFSGANIIGDMDKKTIRLRDIGWRLNVLIHSEFYGGTGGLDGDESLKGKWKPYTVGWCYNVEPLLINSQYQIYQFSFNASQAVKELRHGGVPLDFHADYATIDALIAAAVAVEIPDGTYATCLAQSLVLPSIDITRSIRVDVEGDATIQNLLPPPNTRAAIVRRIATCYGDSKIDDTTEIHVEAFTEFGQEHPGIVGFHWKNETNKADALDEIMSGPLGWWHVKPNGQLSIGYAREPQVSDSVIDIAFQAYGMGLIEMIDFSTPRTGSQIGWRRNYGPETRDQLAGSVSEENARLLGEESRYAVSADSSILVMYPTAETVKLQGNYWFEDDAQQEAERQQSLMGRVRRRFRWSMEIDAFVDIVDKVAKITNVNRLTLGSEKALLCVGIDSVGFGAVTTEWWG